MNGEGLQKVTHLLLPGIVFQSVIMAGGYGTGREIVEYFLKLGAYSGLLAMLVVAVTWSLICALTFEFARRFSCYDYKSFFRKLLGPFDFIFELSYLGVVLIVVSVIISSAGSMLRDSLDVPYALGAFGMMAYVAFMITKGSTYIEKAMSGWTILLYLVYIGFFVTAFATYGQEIASVFTNNHYQSGWLTQGIKYAGYNLGLIPAVLFTVRHIKTRREALLAGLFSGLVAIVPGILFFIALVGKYPQVLGAEIPAIYLLKAMDAKVLSIIYHVFLFGTLIETGVGLIHAVCERYSRVRGGPSRKLRRLLITFSVLLVSFSMAQLGIIALISKGYEILTWTILLTFILPLLTVGCKKLALD